jgi:hypothetical protein
MAVVAGLPLPPSNVPMVDPRTGDLNLQWKNYYLALQGFLAAIQTAPIDAKYWTSTFNGQLTDETNLGLLPSGYLKVTTAVGVATPSTVTTIPAGDISPPPPPNNATYWTSTAEPALSAETNLGGLPSGYLRQSTLGGFATPSTTPTIPASDISPVPAPTDASYWTATAEPALSAETNLGALPSGYLKQTTAAGVATPSTVPTIPLADISPAVAPAAASYWTATSEPDLSAETNLGALPTGYLKQTTAAGVATPSTTPTIPLTDISPTPSPSTASYWTSTAEPALSAETNLGALATGYLKQTTVAGVATPSTVTTIPASDISPPPPTNAASFWTSTSEPGLSNEVNMGALTTGWLWQNVAGGVSTPQAFPGSALTGVNDVNVTITLTGLPSEALLQAVTATMGWAGTLSTARGGTGANNSGQVYTPTLLNEINVTSSTPFQFHFFRVGNVVMVSGVIAVTPTAANTNTELGIELPIPSAFTGFDQCTGSGAASIVFGYSVTITANGTTHRAQMAWNPGVVLASTGITLTFMYLVV